METVYIVLYTHQKTKKAKTWQDGTLKVLPTGTKAVLYDDKGSKLDAVHVRASDVVSGEQLESDRYFIQVEERQKQSSHPATQPNDATSASRLTDSQTASCLTYSQTSQRPEAGHSVTSDTRPSPSVGGQGGLKRKRSGFIPPRVVRARAEEEETRPTDCGYAGYGLRDSAPSFAAPERTQQHPHPVYTPFGRHGNSQPATSHRAENGAAGIRNVVEHHQTVEAGNQLRPGLFGTGRSASASPSSGPGVAGMLGRDVRPGSGDGMETSLSSPVSTAPRLAPLTTNSPWRTFGSVLTRTSPSLQSRPLSRTAATQQGNLSERVQSSPTFPSHPMSHTVTRAQSHDRGLHSSRLLQPESARQVVHGTGTGPTSDVTSWNQLSPGVTTLDDESSCPIASSPTFSSIASSPTFPSAVSGRPAGQKAYGGNQEASKHYNPNFAHSHSSKPAAKRSASQIMALLGKSQLHTAPVRSSKTKLQANSISVGHSVKMISTNPSPVNSNYQNSLKPADSATTPMASAGVQKETISTMSPGGSHSDVDGMAISCPDKIRESISEQDLLWHSAADGKKLDENSQKYFHSDDKKWGGNSENSFSSDDSQTVRKDQCVSRTGPPSSLSHVAPQVGTVASPRLSAYTPSLSKHDFEEQYDEEFEHESVAATSRQQSQAKRDADNSQCLSDWDFPVSDLGTQNSQQQLSQTSLTSRISSNCDVAIDRSGNPAVQMQRGENCDDVVGELFHGRKAEPLEDSRGEENTEEGMKPRLTVGTPLAPEANPKCGAEADEVETAECVDDDNFDTCFDMSLSPLSEDPGSDTDDLESSEQLPVTRPAKTLPLSSLVGSGQVSERCGADDVQNCEQLPVTRRVETQGETLPSSSQVESGQVSERCGAGDESGTLGPGKSEQSQDETDKPVAVQSSDVRNSCHQQSPQQQTSEDEMGALASHKNSNGNDKGTINSALSVLSCVAQKGVGDERESPGEQQVTQTLDAVTDCDNDSVGSVVAVSVDLNQEQEKTDNVIPQEATQREHDMETGEQNKTTLSDSHTERLPASQSSSNRPAAQQADHDDTQQSEPAAENTANSTTTSQAWALDSKSLHPQDNLQDMRTLNDLDISPDSVALYCPSQQFTIPDNDDLDNNVSKSQSSRDLSQSADTQQVLTSQFQQQSLGEAEPMVGNEDPKGLYNRESDERNDVKIQSSGHCAYPDPYISSTKLSPFSPTLLALASQSPAYSNASESDRTHLSQSSVVSQPYPQNFDTQHSVRLPAGYSDASESDRTHLSQSSVASQPYPQNFNTHFSVRLPAAYSNASESDRTYLSQSSVASQSYPQNFNTQHSVCLPAGYKRNAGLEDPSVSKTPRLDDSYSMGGRASASPHSHSAQENTDPYYQLTGNSQLQLNASDDVDSCKSSPSALPVLRGCQTLSEVLGERKRKAKELVPRNCYSEGPVNRQNLVSGMRQRENSSPVGRNDRLSGIGQRQTWSPGSKNGPSSGIEQRQTWNGGGREEDEEDPMSALQKSRTRRDCWSPDVCQQQQLCFDSGSGSLSVSSQRSALSSLPHPDQLTARRGAELTAHRDRPAVDADITQAISARLTGYRMQGMVAGSMVERPTVRRSQAHLSPTALTHADRYSTTHQHTQPPDYSPSDRASPVWRGEWLTREGDRGGQPLTGHAAWTPEAQLLSPSGDAVASSERSFFVDWHDGKPCFVNTQHHRQQEMQAEHSTGVAQQVPQFADGLTMLTSSPPARQHSDSRLLQVHTPPSLSQNSPATNHSYNHNLELQDQDFYMSHPANTQIHSHREEMSEKRNVDGYRKVMSHPTQIHSQSVDLREERDVEGYRKNGVKEESTVEVEPAGREDVISVSSDSQPSVSAQHVVSFSQHAPNSTAPSDLQDNLSPQLFSQAPCSFKPRQRDRQLKPMVTAPEDSSQGGSEVNAAEDSSQGGADVQAEEDIPQGVGNTQAAREPPIETDIKTHVGCVSDAMEADHIELGDFDDSFPESAMLEESHLEAERTAPSHKVSSNCIAWQAQAGPHSVITGQLTGSSTQVLCNFSPRQKAAPNTIIADKPDVSLDSALPGHTDDAKAIVERGSLPASVAKVDRDRHSVTDRDSAECWVEEDGDGHSVTKSSSSGNASCASTVSSPGIVVSNQALDCVEEEGQRGRDRGGQGEADRRVGAGHKGQWDPSLTGLAQRSLPVGKLQGKASRLLSQIQALRPPASSLGKESHSTPRSQQRFPARPSASHPHRLSATLTSDRHNGFQSGKRQQNVTDTVDLLVPSAATDSPPLDFSPASCTGQSPVMQATLCEDNQGTSQHSAVHRSFPHTQHHSSSPAPSIKHNHDFRSPAFEGNSVSSQSVTEEQRTVYAGFSPHDGDVGLKGPTESRSLMTARKVGLGKFKKPGAACFTANLPTTQFQTSLCGELQFCVREDVESYATPERHVVIPPSFDSVASYRHVLTAALTEFLNIQLFDVAKTYHSALSQVDVSAYTEGASVTGKPASGSSNPACKCGNPSKVAQVKKDGPNKARFFYTCSGPRHKQCKFFQWVDQQSGNNTSARGRASATIVKPKLTDPDSIMGYYRGLKLPLYCQCRFVRRCDDQRFKQGFPAWVRPRQNGGVQKKSIFIRLPKKDSATTHAKDDLWVVSKSLSFVKGETFVARSTFHGPNTHAEVAVETLAGYSASLWDDGSVCHAIHCGNAATELTCMANLQDHVDPSSLPILLHLLDNQPSSSTASRPGRGFKAPSVTHNSSKLHIPAHFVHELATEFITRYGLNTDQAAALRQAADMMNKDADPASSLLLIHGVFGAGKSFLLSVLILFLVEVFQRNDTYCPGVPFPWKLLLSSTTNVAVDRVLLGLLELGFDDFVRVGSVKKIAKPVLPYSVHAGGSESHELKDLQEMLKSQDITPAEKHCVRKSIERHRLGENRKRLGAVRVVGVTCAACTFHCLHNMQFPFVVLDECSQMTEPASLLPIARFACDKLVLVGDPKQLDPTLQGSSAAHRAGLEQTLFDRLINMGHDPVMLRTQYRCHPVISAVSNSLFYHGQLRDGVTVLDRAPILDVFPTMCFYDVSTGQEQTDWSGSYVNEAEAQFVSLLLAVVMARGLQAHSVGVITLYKAQARRIIDILRNYGCDTQRELSGVQVSTVDAFQGGERDVMILSTVRTGSLGFIDSDKRMNVALTRGRHHLLIVGHQRNLHGNKRWAQVISHCQAVQGGITSSVAASRKLQGVLDSVADHDVTEATDGVTGDHVIETTEDMTGCVTLTDSGDDATDVGSGRRVDLHSGDRTLHSQRLEHVQHASDTQCTHSPPLSHQGSREEGSGRYEADMSQEGGGGGGGKSRPSRVKPLVADEDSEGEDGASSDDCLPDGL